MMGYARTLAIALLVMALCVVGIRQASGQEGADLIWRNAIEMKLERSVSCSFEDTPLRDVVEFLEQMTKVNFVLDSAATAEDEHLVTLTLNDVSVRSMLSTIMGTTGLDYILKDQAVFISTKERTRSLAPYYLRTYDVRDLMFVPEDVGGSDSSSDDDDDDDDDDDQTTAERGSSNILRLIMTLTGRENWRSVNVVGIARGDEDDDRGGDEEGW